MRNQIIDLPPKAYADFLVENPDLAQTAGHWRESQTWKVWKAGFNAAVSESNRRTLAKYAMRLEGSRCVAGPAPAPRNQFNGREA